jgi:hypothetical protein
MDFVEWITGLLMLLAVVLLVGSCSPPPPLPPAAAKVDLQPYIEAHIAAKGWL